MRLRIAGYRVSILVIATLLSYAARGQERPARITLDPGTRFQTIDGFGVNFNGTYFRDSQKPMIQGLVTDLGATIFRLDPYGLINWEAANDNADPNVMDWQYYNDRYSIPEFEAAWSAARYLNSLGIRPYLTLSGIPPAWMLNEDLSAPHEETCTKDTRSHLNPQMYGEFAETVVSLAMYARNTAHIDFEYFGPVNETDCYPAEGPRIDPDEMPKLLIAVASRLQKEGLGDVKLVVPEQAHMANDYIEEILKHPELMPQVGAFSLHSYSDTADAQPHVDAVRQSQYPDVPVWLTEYGDLNDLDRSAENEWKGFSVRATRRALRALNQGVTAALYWDAFDNYHEHYPRLTYYGLIRNSDHVYTPKKRYYAAKQLYHFVHPGAQRIAVQAPQGQLVSGFVNGDDGSVAVVGVQESGPERINIVLPAYNGMVQVYQTTRRLDCQKTATVPVSNGSAEIHLQKDSIFTLVFTGSKGQF
jgi:O-glycosyl hydrolase